MTWGAFGEWRSQGEEDTGPSQEKTRAVKRSRCDHTMSIGACHWRSLCGKPSWNQTSCVSGVGEPGLKSFGRIRSFLLIFAADPRGCKSSTVLLFEFRWEHFDDSSLLSMTFVKILQVNNYSNTNKQKASSVFANSQSP